MSKTPTTTFSELTCPSGLKITMIDGKGEHLLAAVARSNDDSRYIAKFLVLELCMVDGAPMTEDYINEMSIPDLSYLLEVVALQLTNSSDL